MPLEENRRRNKTQAKREEDRRSEQDKEYKNRQAINPFEGIPPWWFAVVGLSYQMTRSVAATSSGPRSSGNSQSNNHHTPGVF